MNIKKTFLKLTEYTTPNNVEYLIVRYLPNGIKMDEYGNYYLRLGKSRSMFTCHLDDVSWNYEKINHVIDKNYIKTDGRTILGADDKAGVTVLLNMIYNKIPGTYYFFIGEESGMQGSNGILNIKKQWFIDNFDRCISFDRRGYGSIISSQIGMKCCSDIFVNSLKEQFDNLDFIHRNDPNGIYTDSAAFIGIIPECTNISVGYFNEHSTREYQDISYLDKLCKNVLKINWEVLPIGSI